MSTGNTLKTAPRVSFIDKDGAEWVGVKLKRLHGSVAEFWIDGEDGLFAVDTTELARQTIRQQVNA